MKVLILAVADFDAELLEYELEKLKVPLSLRLVVTRAEFSQALEEFRPSLILADCRLPAGDSLTALALAQENCPETPFILVSGTPSPELAVAGLQPGVAAWLPRNQPRHLAAPALESWTPEEHLWPRLVHHTRKVMLLLDLDGSILEFNRGAELHTGWQRHEVLGRDFVALLVASEHRQWAAVQLARVAAGEHSLSFELSIRNCRGAGLWSCQPTLLEDLQGRAEGILLLADDVDGRVQQPKNRAARTFSVKGRPNLLC